CTREGLPRELSGPGGYVALLPDRLVTSVLPEIHGRLAQAYPKECYCQTRRKAPGSAPSHFTARSFTKDVVEVGVDLVEGQDTAILHGPRIIDPEYPDGKCKRDPTEDEMYSDDDGYSDAEPAVDPDGELC
ncbi:MAG TPA: hypothetical protein VLM91_16880, partial [Candidatus Methylomirabilis sp.]|nr:hypothetical protein [Candidatus Methylomirabilis sp.]